MKSREGFAGLAWFTGGFQLSRSWSCFSELRLLPLVRGLGFASGLSGVLQLLQLPGCFLSQNYSPRLLLMCPARYYSTPLIPITPGFKHPAWPLALKSSKSPGPCLPLALLPAWRSGWGHVQGMKMPEELCAGGCPAAQAVCLGLGTPFGCSLEGDGFCLQQQMWEQDLIE